MDTRIPISGADPIDIALTGNAVDLIFDLAISAAQPAISQTEIPRRPVDRHRRRLARFQ
jgi:hypothetical protein